MKRAYYLVFTVILFFIYWPLFAAQGKSAPRLEGRLALIAFAAPGPWQNPKAPVESNQERLDRLETLAYAVALESEAPPPGWTWGSEELAALLMATTYEEGRRWHKDVHSGNVTGDKGKARCLAQLHKSNEFMPRDKWLDSTGTDLVRTRICIAGAARVLAHYSSKCVGGWREKDLESAFARIVAGYGTGKGCDARGKKWAWERSQRAVRWLKELRK